VIYDFGVSQCFEGTDDQMQDTPGTYLYMAPEVMIKPATGPKVIRGMRTDIWGAGISLFQIAFGRHPFNTKKGLFGL
jgi:serine/threonine protein kinase